MDSARDLPNGRGFPIRTSADQRSLASPRGFSQRATSFIASRRQGIHRTPLSCSGQRGRRPRPRAPSRARARPSAPQRPTSNQPTSQSNPSTNQPPCSAAARAQNRAARQTNGETRTKQSIERARAQIQTRTHARDTPNPDSPVKERRNGFGGAGAGAGGNTRPPARRPAAEARTRRPWTRKFGPAGGPDLEAIGFEPTTPCLQSRCSPG
jgi:hypothetical protein